MAGHAINSPVMRYHGAKFRLAPWVMSFFPPHTRYVESFGGAAGVLMQKQKIQSEVYNDLDGSIVNVFRVLQDPVMREQLAEKIAFTPYHRDEFLLAYEETDDMVEMARRTLILAHMGFGSAGATGTTGFRIDSRRAYGLPSQLWSKYPDKIAAFGERLEGVIIDSRPAATIIQAHDDDETLQFVDPPYLPETRHQGGNKFYKHEMSPDDHIELINVLKEVQSSVVLCGYPSELYKDMLGDWKMHTTKARISAGRGTGIKTECIWLNDRCLDKQRQIGLNI